MKLAIALLVSAALLSASYISTPCSLPCSIQSGSHQASPQEMSALTDSVFDNWMDANNWGEYGEHFTVSGVKSNGSGFMVGNFSSLGITSSFIYSSGSLTCCVPDTPSRITDFNTNGMLVGYDNFGGFLKNIRSLDKIKLSFDDGFGINSNSMFAEIDNQDRILLYQEGKSYLLTPVPETGTFGLFLLAGLGFYLKKSVLQ